MHYLISIGRVAVLVAIEDGESLARAVEAFDASHDVNHGFGGDTWYCRASNVFNRASHQPRADCVEKNRAFSLKHARPIFIVRNDVHWCVVGHSSLRQTWESSDLGGG